MNLTKASDKLYLTFSKLDSDGNAIKEAYFIDKLMNLIDDLTIEEENMTSMDKTVEDEDFYAHILANNKGIDYLAHGLRNRNIEDMSDEWIQLYDWYKRDINKKDDLERMLNEAFFTNNDMYISKNVANLIYKNAEKSVTEIERYASCAYAHFLNYGLKLRKRRQYEIELPDIGTLFHNTLDMFSKQLIIDKKSWESITLEECNAVIDKCVDEVTKEYGGLIMHSSKRNEYLINRIKDISKRTVKTLKKHIHKGKFVPIGYEVRFDSSSQLDATNIKIDAKDKIGLRGAIDRLDVADVDIEINDGADISKEEYVKVIDYKSSSQKFEPALFMEGIQLQLMVYMGVALDTRKEQVKDRVVRPAGVFYYTVDNPFVEKDEKIAISIRQSVLEDKENILEEKNEQSKDDEDANEKQVTIDIIPENETIEKGILDQLVMKGIVNNDPYIIERIDHSLIDEEGKIIPKAKSDVIKISATSKGELSARANAITDEDFDVLMNKTKDIIRDNVIKMRSGNISKNPYKFGEKTPCTYCDDQGICNFDINLEDNNYKRIAKKTMDEMLDVLNPKTEEEEI
jgi:ATP-dependent helicase/nuclease subunit B